MSRWLTCACMCVGIIAVCGVNGEIAYGEPGPADLKSCKSSLLKRAVAVDLRFVPAENANQREAEKYYLQFIQENPDSHLVPLIYDNLGHMYTDKVDASWQAKFGHKKDDVRARDYFKKAVEAHPPMLSSLLVGSRVCATALAPTREEVVDEYIEFYKWLSDMKKEEIGERLWLRESTKRAIARRPARIEQSVNSFWELRLGMQQVAKVNMLAVAESAETPIQLLDRIVEAFPEHELGEEARRAKNDMLARNPLLATQGKSHLWGVVSAWAVGLGLPCAVVAFIAFKARRRGVLASRHASA